MGERRRVAVVTGGGGGIGAAIAEAIGRTGTHVVTLDPLVSVDGSEQLAEPSETTADRIVAAGGSAQATSLSVTDAVGVRALFAALAHEHGGLDAVVNVAGITRPTSIARGSEDDWRSVLEVHLDGYLNVLRAALPLMAAAGHGRVLGVTSGSGWRAADAGAYSCAKRAVAAITWQLGRACPPGVVVNAISPIAATRMVTAALNRARPSGAGGGAGGGGARSKGSATGGLSLSSMPTPDELGPLGAHLVADDLSWLSGRVIFTAGSEVAVVDEPRLLEVVRLDGASSTDKVLDAVTPALAEAESSQATGGGSNARFVGVFGETGGERAEPRPVATCALVTADANATTPLVTTLRELGVTTCVVEPSPAGGFDAARQALATAEAELGSLDAVVVVRPGSESGEVDGAVWEQILREHDGIVEHLHADASWVRAAADHATGADRPLRVITLTGATTAGGRSRAQAAAQLARAAHGATDGRVAAMAVSVEVSWSTGAEGATAVVAHLLGLSEPASLSGAELVLGDGWLGLRSHPRPGGSISYGGPEIPTWFDDSLAEIAGVRREGR